MFRRSLYYLVIIMAGLFAGTALSSSRVMAVQVSGFAEEPVDEENLPVDDDEDPDGTDEEDIPVDISEYGTSVSTDNTVPYDLRASLNALEGSLSGKLGNTSLSDYNVLQGGCADNRGYAYYAMMHNNNSESTQAYYRKYCLIVKVRLSDMTITDVSEPLLIYHGNDLTYNPGTGCLYAVHCVDGTSADRRRVSVINADTLALSGTHTITLDPSAAEEDLSRYLLNETAESYLADGNVTAALEAVPDYIVDFSGIACQEINGVTQYALLVRYSSNILIVDEDFHPVRYIRESDKSKALFSDYTTQGIDCNEQYIIISKSMQTNMSSSPRKYDNILLYYSWKGKILKKVSVKGVTHEIENIYHTTSAGENDSQETTFYMSCYAYSWIWNKDGVPYELRLASIYTISDTETTKHDTAISLSKTSLSLTPGGKGTLQTTFTPSGTTFKKVYYTSKNPAVATISSTGAVSAKAMGATTLYAVSADSLSTARCRVTVSPSAPTPKAPVNTTKGVSFSWTRVSSAKGYYVYRKLYGSSDYGSPIKKISGNTTLSYTDTSVTSKKDYLYTVTAYANGVNDTGTTTKTTEVSSGKPAGRRVTYVAAPTRLRIRRLSGYRLKTIWKAASGISGYQIQYSLSPKFTRGKTVTQQVKKSEKKAVSRVLKKKKKYYVRIRAYALIDGKRKYSAWSDVVKKKTGPKAEPSLSAK